MGGGSWPYQHPGCLYYWTGILDHSPRHTLSKETQENLKLKSYSGSGILQHMCSAMHIGLAAGVQAITGRQQHMGSASVAEPRLFKLPRRTREDKRSRLTLSPAVPPDWMHSIQSPGGQITQTPVSVTCQPQSCLRDAGCALSLMVMGCHGPLASENRENR